MVFSTRITKCEICMRKTPGGTYFLISHATNSLQVATMADADGYSIYFDLHHTKPLSSILAATYKLLPFYRRNHKRGLCINYPQ